MKKIVLETAKETVLKIAALGAFLGACALAQEAGTNAVPAAPHLSITERTNVIRTVAPLMLSADAMDGVIAACMSLGVSADERITATNLAFVEVRAVKIGTNDAFRVMIRLK